MRIDEELERYLEQLAGVLGHAERRAVLLDYCRGLMLPIKRKSVEPLAAHLDPLHMQAKYQSLHHFVAKSAWSDGAVLREVRAVVEPALELDRGCYWIIDDTGLPKQGTHSVGVTRQYCGQLGQDRELPGRGQPVPGRRQREPADPVAHLLAEGMGGGSAPPCHGGHTGRDQVREQA